MLSGQSNSGHFYLTLVALGMIINLLSLLAFNNLISPFPIFLQCHSTKELKQQIRLILFSDNYCAGYRQITLGLKIYFLKFWSKYGSHCFCFCFLLF